MYLVWIAIGYCLAAGARPMTHLLFGRKLDVDWLVSDLVMICVLAGAAWWKLASGE